ncbi:MAG: EI24 domain-containing protein [Verrucomicrobiota bacterium]
MGLVIQNRHLNQMVKRTFIPGLWRGFSSYLRVIPALFKHGLWPYQLLPAIVSLVLSVVMLVVFYFLASLLSGALDSIVHAPWQWLDATMNYTVGILTFLILATAFVFLHKHLVIVVLSPALGKIAEATYRAVLADSSESPLSTSASISRSIRINFGNITKEVLINLGFLLCNFIPVAGSAIATGGLFLNQARFLGFGLMDFPLEHKGFSVPESMTFMKQRAGCATGLGAGYILLMLIPFVGWMFAPTFGTVAGTLAAIRELDSPQTKPKVTGE